MPKKEITMNIKKDDRIRLTKMENDPRPKPVGTEGTVTNVYHVNIYGGFTQVSVKWDNGRTLMLTLPEDEYELI